MPDNDADIPGSAEEPPIPVEPVELFVDKDDEVVKAVDLQHRAVQGSLATAINVVVSTPTAAVGTVIVARLLQPSAYGRLAYLSIALTLTLSASDFGMNAGLVQWGAASAARRDKAATAYLTSSGNGFRLLVQLPVLLVVGLILIRTQPAWVQETFVLAMVMSVATAGATVVMTLQNRTAPLAVLAMISNVVVQVGIVAAAWRWRAPGPVWVVRLAIGVAFAAYPIFLVDRADRRQALWPRLPRKIPDGFWRFALLSWAGGLLVLLVYSRSEVFVLSYYHQSRNLGIFALGFGLSQQLTTPVDAMLGPLLPASAALLSAHPARAERALLRGLRFSSLMCGGIAAMLIPAVYFVVPLVYGSGYHEVAGIFLVLGLISTLQSVSHPINALYTARRRAGVILGVNGATLVVDGAVAVGLIPLLGAWGAVVANSTTQIVSSAWFAFLEFRHYDIRGTTLLLVWRSWFLGAVSLGIALLAGRVSPYGDPIVRAALAAVVGGLAYVLLIRSFGGVLDDDDRAVILRVVPARVRGLLDAVASVVSVRPGS
ncbi:MAG: lipopolysaccharide biosynthesis protein [Acidimicrobiales bacterium]